MMELLVRFVRNENGEDLIEYGLLAAFAATVGATIVFGPLGLEDAILAAFQRARDALRA